MGSAVVVMYNVDLLGDLQYPLNRLTFDLDCVVGIFSGTIDRWNDPAIAAANPGMADSLPDTEMIVVVRGEPSGTTDVFTRSLSRMSPLWAATVGNGSSVDWPIPSGRVRFANSTSDVTTAVISNLGAVGFNVLQQAMESDLPYAAWDPRAPGAPAAASAAEQTVLLPTSASLSLAMVEWYSDFSAEVRSDIAGIRANGIWPFAGYTYVVVRHNYTRPGSSCQQRAVVGTFWSWFLGAQSPVRRLQEDLGFAPLPALVATHVVDSLLEATHCIGDEASEVVTERPFVVGSPPIGVLVVDLVGLAFTETVGVGTEFVARTVVDGEWNYDAPPDIGLLPQFDIPAVYQSAPGEPHIDIPTSAEAIVMVYSLPGWESSSGTLVLSVRALVGILLGDITRWNDAQIVEDNGGAAMPDLPIVLVARGDLCDENLVLTYAMSERSDAFAAAVGVRRSITLPGASRTAFTTGEAMADLSQVDGALAYVMFVETHDFPIARMLEAGHGDDQPIVATPRRLTDCVSETLGLPDFEGGRVCWPLQIPMFLRFKTQFYGSECRVGELAMRFLLWFTEHDEITPVLEDLKLGAPPQVNPALLRGLISAISCDGDSILNPPLPCTRADYEFDTSQCDAGTQAFTVSFQWKVPRTCKGGVSLPHDFQQPCSYLPWGSPQSIIVAIAVTLSLIPPSYALYWTARNRGTQTVRMMQPTFLVMFASGAFVTNLSPLWFVGPDSFALCNVRAWYLNITFTLTFAALFAKLYRVWRLFVNAKAKKRIVSNKYLFRIVGACVGFDVVVCALWTLLDPPGTVTSTVEAQGLDDVVFQFPTCLGGDQDSVFELLLVFFKVAILFSGTFLAAQTWNVTQLVSEGRPLAIAIFNIAWVAVLLSLVLAVGANPGVVVILLALGTVYSNTAAITAVFAPKIQLLRKGQDGLPLDANGGQSSASSVVKSPAHRRAASEGSGSGVARGRGASNMSNASQTGTTPPGESRITEDGRTEVVNPL